jgi:hypothetical protein
MARGYATALTSAARTTSADFPYIVQGKNLTLYLDVTAASGSTPTLDIKLQAKDPASSNWYDVPGGVFTQATTTTNQRVVVTSPVGESLCRLNVVIGGGTPSFTFSVGAQWSD